MPLRASFRRLHLLLLTGVLGGAALSPLGCSGDTLNGPPPISAAHAYWTLQIAQPHAINLALNAPYDTVRLSAVARNALGTALAGLGPVVWTAALDSSVQVDATGLVTALKPTGLTYVVATLQNAQQGLTLRDSVFILVNPTATPIRTFSVQPVPGDSAIRSRYDPAVRNNLFNWYVTAVDSAGTAPSDTVCALADSASGGCQNFLVAYGSSNAKIVNLTGGCVPPAMLCQNFAADSVGTAYVTATTLAYGQLLRDSVRITIKPPAGYTYQLLTTTPNDTVFTAVGFDGPSSLTVGAGAVMTWSAYGSGNTVPFDIEFDPAGAAAADTASCVVTAVHGLLRLLVRFNIYPLAFPPTGSGNTDLFGTDTTGLGHELANGQTVPTIQFDGGADSSWFTDNCRARRFRTPGTYHWHSSLFPTQTYTLTVVP